MHSVRVREFRPPLITSKTPYVLLTIIILALAVPVALMVTLFSRATKVEYKFDGQSLLIETGFILDGNERIDRSAIREIAVRDLTRGYRSMGTYMPGYCTGRWTYQGVGTVWQATDCRAHGLLISAAGLERPLWITPPDPELTKEKLEKGEPFTVTFDPPTSSMGGALLAAVLGLVAVSGTMISLLLLKGPRKIVYRVGDGRIELETMFSKKSFRLPELRARRIEPEKCWRLAGTGFPGYFTGLYRVDGTNTRVYATQLKSGILLEGEQRILLTPADEAAFLEAIRKEGAVVE